VIANHLYILIDYGVIEERNKYSNLYLSILTHPGVTWEVWEASFSIDLAYLPILKYLNGRCVPFAGWENIVSKPLTRKWKVLLPLLSGQAG